MPMNNVDPSKVTRYIARRSVTRDLCSLNIPPNPNINHIQNTDKNKPYKTPTFYSLHAKSNLQFLIKMSIYTPIVSKEPNIADHTKLPPPIFMTFITCGYNHWHHLVMLAGRD